MVDLGFRFDEEKHLYTFDGLKVPGVSEILKGVGLIKDVYAEDGGFSRDRGKAAHKAVWLDCKNDLDENTLDEIVVPYFQDWRILRETIYFEPILEYCEKPLYHPVLKFAGTPDLVVMKDGHPVLIDLKTGSVSSWVAYQTAAYRELLKANGILIKHRYYLNLKGDGRPKLVLLPDPNDINIFISALNVFNAQGRCVSLAA